MKERLKVRVFYHDKCFGGHRPPLSSRAFYRERILAMSPSFSGLLHAPGPCR